MRASRAIAGALAATSAGVAVAAVETFRRHRTTVDPLHPDRANTLVTTGANQVTRNPMYVGMAGLLVSHALLRRSWIALVPAGLFVLIIDRTQVAAEEAALLERFGAEFDAYRTRVPRWLGRASRR